MATGGSDPGGGARKKTFMGSLFKKKDKLGESSTNPEMLANSLRAKMADIRDLITGTQFNQTYQRIRHNIDASPALDLVYQPLDGAMMKMDQYRSKLEGDVWKIECELQDLNISMAHLQQLEPRVNRLMQEAHFVHAILKTINAHRFSLEQLFYERRWFEKYRPHEVPDRSIYEFTYLAHPWTMAKDLDTKFNEYGEVAYVISREFMKIYRDLQKSPQFLEKDDLLNELSNIKERFTQADEEVVELEEALANLPEEEMEKSIEVMNIAGNFMRHVGKAYQLRTRMYEIDRLRQVAETRLPIMPGTPTPGLTLRRPRSDAISEGVPLPQIVQEDPFGGLSPIVPSDAGSVRSRPGTPSPIPLRKRSSDSSLHGPLGSLRIGTPGLSPIAAFALSGTSSRRRFELPQDFTREMSPTFPPRVRTPPLSSSSASAPLSPSYQRSSQSPLQFQLSQSASRSQSTHRTLSPEEFMFTPQTTPMVEQGGVRIPGRTSPIPSFQQSSSLQGTRSSIQRRLSFSDSQRSASGSDKENRRRTRP